MQITPTTRVALIAGAALASVLLTAPTAAAERLNDKDVQQLIDRINHERDRFEDQLDGRMKRSVIRNAAGETDVSKYLDDLQDNVNKLKDRYTPSYAASAEATTVLRQASDIKRFMATQPAAFDGASEWNRLEASLGELAAVYGTTLPLPDGQQARRMNDAEVKSAAATLAKTADQFKKALDGSLKADKAVDKAAREAALKEADGLKEDAEQLASTVGDGRPATGEAKALLQRAAGLKAATSGRTLSPAAQTAWQSIESGLGTLAQVFGLPPGS